VTQYAWALPNRAETDWGCCADPELLHQAMRQRMSPLLRPLPVQAVPSQSAGRGRRFAARTSDSEDVPVSHRCRAATPEQLRITEEAQGEVGLDFRPFFPELTSWQAAALIKGFLVVSEVQWPTGDRHFSPRDLRRAIREYVQRSQGSMAPIAISVNRISDEASRWIRCRREVIEHPTDEFMLSPALLCSAEASCASAG
jgi:hypothetical protein